MTPHGLSYFAYTIVCFLLDNNRPLVDLDHNSALIFGLSMQPVAEDITLITRQVTLPKAMEDPEKQSKQGQLVLR